MLFLMPPKLMAVLPPIEASTIASSVVGTLIWRMPRLNPADTYPPRSQTHPPPRLTMTLPVSAPLSSSVCHTCAATSRLLHSSPAGTSMNSASSSGPTLVTSIARHCWNVFSSSRIKYLASRHSSLPSSSPSMRSPP